MAKRKLAPPKLLQPVRAPRAAAIPDGPKYIDPACETYRSRATQRQWTTCWSCNNGGPLCPEHVKAHFSAHNKNPAQCWITRKQWKPWV